MIESLSPEQIEDLHRYRQEWANPARSEGADRIAIETSIGEIYERIRLKRPAFIWCDSIFQYVTIRALMFLWVADDSGKLSAALDRELTDPIWSACWKSLKDQLEQSPATREVLQNNFNQLKAGSPMPQSDMGSSSLMEQLGHTNVETKITIAVAEATSKIEKAVPELLGIRAKLQIRSELYTGLRAENRQMVRVQLARSIGSLITGDPQAQFFSQLSEETKELIETACNTYLQRKESVFLSHIFGNTGEKKPLTELLFQDALNDRYSLIADPRFSSSDNLPGYSFILEILEDGLDENAQELLKNYLRVKKSFIEFEPYKNLCLVCEAPQSFLLNQRHFLHNDNGPAITFRDGYKVFSLNGVTVSPKLLEQPESITIEEITRETNVELRRIMIQRYGVERYTEDSGAKIIDSDQYGTLYKKEQQSDEPIVIVKVINATPEPDGSGPKQYFLRVPPHIVTAKEAVAWTFNMSDQEYQPSEQS